ENAETGLSLRVEKGAANGEDGPQEFVVALTGPVEWMVSSDGKEAGFYHEGARVARLELPGGSNARMETSADGPTGMDDGNGRAASGMTLAGRASNATGHGLSTTPDWIADGNQGGANYGISVSAAGGVNGDGYGDVIVGAYFYDVGHVDDGRAYLYLG